MIENPERICIPSNRIGSGSYREVFRDPETGLIVKKNRHYYTTRDDEHGNNLSEWRTYEYLRDNWPVSVPDYVKLPVMALVDGYIVAEYVDGYAPHYADELHGQSWRQAVNETGLHDMHSDNVRVDAEENIWIIDLGHGSWLDPEDFSS